MRFLDRLALLAVLFFASALASRQSAAEEPAKVAGVVYRKVGDATLKLDLYLPARREGSTSARSSADAGRALIVWVHGGAWRAGTKADVPILALTEHGFAIASVDYRLSPQAKFPAQSEDLHAAVRFLRSNAAKYDLDAERIAIAGSSAGGHLAALVGLTADVASVGGGEGENGRASRVRAVVSFYGASNLESILAQSTPHGRSVRVPALKLLLGGLPEERTELARLASPVAHVDAGDPPLLLIHGDADPQMPYAQAIELRDAYRRLDRPVELITVEDGAHGGERFYDDATLSRVVAFLERHLASNDETN